MKSRPITALQELSKEVLEMENTYPGLNFSSKEEQESVIKHLTERIPYFERNKDIATTSKQDKAVYLFCLAKLYSERYKIDARSLGLFCSAKTDNYNLHVGDAPDLDEAFSQTLVEEAAKTVETLKEIDRNFLDDGLIDDFENELKIAYQDLGNACCFYGDLEGAYKSYVEAMYQYASMYAGYRLILLLLNDGDYNSVSAYNVFLNMCFVPQYHNKYDSDYIYSAWQLLYKHYFQIGDYENAKESISDFVDRFASYPSMLSLYKEDMEKCKTDCECELRKLKELEEKNSNTNSDELLKAYFKEETVSKMKPEIKIFIQTSIYLYDLFTKSKPNESLTFDYSSVNMPIFKALESLLHTIYAEHYFSYVKENHVTEDGSLPPEMVNEFPKQFEVKGSDVKLAKKVDALTIGNAIYATRKYWENTPCVRTVFMGFCISECNVSDKKRVLDFVTKLENIKNLRNQNAHRYRITKADADKCRNELLTITKFIEEIYDLFGKIL